MKTRIAPALAVLMACVVLALARGAAADEGKPATRNDEADGITFDVPTTWAKETGDAGRMGPKLACKVPAAEGDSEGSRLTVHNFGGMMGGSVDANIARWCGQFKDADGSPLDPKNVKVEKEKVNGLQVSWVELAGTHTPSSFGGPKQDPKPNWKMLAAVVEGEGGPWFIRLVGPAKTIDKCKDAYVALLKSIKAKA